MLRIIADNKIPFLEGALEQKTQVSYMPGGKINRKHLLNADAMIIRTRTKCDEGLLYGTPVKFIASATIGYDHIDTDYCASQGIRWTNAPGCNSGSVRQYIASALATIISQEKSIFSELTLGIVGVGNVGKKIENMARTLGMKVLLNDPPRERMEGSGSFTDLEHLIGASDIITMHVPLIKTGPYKTLHMADENFFSKIKKGAWLINSSRGEVCQTQALTSALKNKQLAGAIVDVWENEPAIDEGLLNLVHVATPHIAGYSADGKANGTAMSVQAISRFFDLKMDNWYPEIVPAAPNNHIDISCDKKSMEEVFTEVSLFAYDIVSDSQKLKSSLATFEEQRGSYPIRREPEALTIELLDNNENCRKWLEELGYNVV